LPDTGDVLQFDTKPDLGFVRRECWEDNNIILTYDPSVKVDYGASFGTVSTKSLRA
jgi:hypothetical protein